jgi:hypothetical protein
MGQLYVGRRIIRVSRISAKTLEALQKRGFTVFIVNRKERVK